MTSHPDGVPIAVAARALGVSEKTIRRRIAAKQLDAHKVYTSQGYEWRVHLPGPGLSTQSVQADDRPPGDLSTPAVQAVARVDTDRLRVVVAELQRTRARVAALEALLPVHGPPDPGPPVALPREVIEYGEAIEGVSHAEGSSGASDGLWARVVAFWRGRA